VKVGDIVKFQSDIQGMESLRGIIISESGPDAVEVYWYQEESRFTHHKGNTTTDLKSFLEVVSESR
jgi:hypothetical protein